MLLSAHTHNSLHSLLYLLYRYGMISETIVERAVKLGGRAKVCVERCFRRAQRIIRKKAL